MCIRDRCMNNPYSNHCPQHPLVQRKWWYLPFSATIMFNSQKTICITCLLYTSTEIFSNRTTSKNKIDELSAKQKQVFNLILSGKSNKEIMDEMCIELSTLKTHINRIYKILGITSRQQIKKLKIQD